MIKAVIFDCFGVLTGDRWKEFVLSLPETQQGPARDLNHALDSGFIDLKEFLQSIHELTGKSVQEVDGVINSEMHKNIPLLEYIKVLSNKYKIGLLSNVSSNWIREEFLSASETKLFDDVLLSYEAGTTKPDPAIYHLAAKRLDVEPSECVFIDDGIFNCQGARDVGMQAIAYKSFVQCRNELEKLLT